MLKINLVLFSILALFFSNVGLVTQDAFGGSCSPVDSIDLDKDVYGFGENAHLTIQKEFGTFSVPIQFTSTSDPTGTTLIIPETAPESGEYEIDIVLTTSGIPIINPGDTITFTDTCEGVISDSATVVIPTYTWDGGAGTDLWSDEENWSSDYVPSGDEIIVIESPFCTSESSAISLDVADFTLDESLHIGSGCSLLIIENYMNNEGTITIDGMLDVTDDSALTNLPSAVINVTSGGELNVLAEGALYNEIGGEINILTGGKLFNSQGGYDVSKGYIQNGATDSIYTDGIIENNGTFANYGHIEVDCNGSIIGSETINDISEDIDFICVAPHPTTVILDPIADPFTGDVFTVTGRLVDDITGLGIPGKIVEFDGTGAGTLTNATTSGFTVTDTVNGITIENVTADNILRPEIGTVISFPSNPTFVTLSLKNMSTNEISVLVTPGEGTTFSATGLGPGINIGLFTISHPDGISSIEVTDISDTGIAGITRVQALNSEQVQYIDEEFADSTTCEECDLPDTLSFAEGSFYSIGTSSATPATDLIVNAHFDGDESYDASETEPCEEDCDTNEQTYSVLSSTAGGVGGTVSVTADTGLGRTSILCAAGNDNDGDSLCNDWETTGIPYTGGSYVLAGANPDRKDVYVEIDYMPGRNPFVAGASNDAIDDVIAAFAAAPFTNGVNLHVDQGEQVTNVSPLIVWTDSANDLDDFNTYKATYFGTSDERANTALLTAKAQAYRYFLFANSIGGSSGIAELRGNDAVVALGTGFDGTRQQYAGTFMHELGHLLNLNHGGPQYLITDVTQRAIADQGVNCKPNHDSIMTYSRQLPTLLGASWRLDFSDGGLGPSAGLRETTLVETAGNLVHTPDTFRPGLALPIIIWGTPGQAQTFLTQVSRVSGGTPADIDWTGNGSPYAASVSKDINNFGITGCAASAPTTTFHKNYDEWRNLDFNFRQGPSGQFDGEDAASNSYPLVINDYDTKTVAELESISSYHNALFPWKADSSLTLKKGIPVPIDVRLFDGANIPLVKGDGTVSYKLYKSGDNTVKASGSLIYDKFVTKSWVTAIHPSKITSKGTWFIEITFTNTAGSHVTRDQIPSTNPIYTNPIPGDPDPLMSLKVTVI